MKLKTIKKEVIEREREIEIEFPFYYKYEEPYMEPEYGVIIDENTNMYFKTYVHSGVFFSIGRLPKPEKIASMIPISKEEFDAEIGKVSIAADAAGLVFEPKVVTQSKA